MINSGFHHHIIRTSHILNILLILFFFFTDGSQAASAQNLDAACERYPLPPSIHCYRRLLYLLLFFLLHLAAVQHEPGVLPQSITLAASVLTPRRLLQRSGPGGLHGAGHQQRASRADRLPRAVSWGVGVWGAVGRLTNVIKYMFHVDIV